MNRLFNFLFLIIIISSCSSSKQAIENSTIGDHQTLGAQIIADLSSDNMQGRVVGTLGIELAASYLERNLKAMGISPYFSSYRDTFKIGLIETYNIVGEIKSKQPTNEYVILSAHYDHIQDKANGNDTIFNGANDNASGVAAVLEIGKILQQNADILQKNVMLVLFSGEELVLKGSQHLASKLKAQDFNLAYLINFEMVGVPLLLGNQKAFITGYNLSDMQSQINIALGQEFIVFEENAERYGLFKRSDNYPFYQLFNVPSQTISTYASPDNFAYYHHVDDEIEALDLNHVEDIITLSSKAILRLLTENIAIELSE